MAFGTLKADTLTHSTAGSLATNFVVDGSAKAWLTHGADYAADNSLNISSTSDDASGKGTMNYTNSMSSTFYCISSLGVEGGQNTTFIWVEMASRATGSVPFSTGTHSGSSTSLGDNDVSHAINGDLA